MKKLTTLAFALLLTLSAHAQIYMRAPFLAHAYLYLTNSGTFLTNILSPQNVTGTNLPTVVITNTVTGAAYSTNGPIVLATVNPFVDVPLWVDRDSTLITGPATNGCIEVGVGYAQGLATNGWTLVFVPMISPMAEDTTSPTFMCTLTNAGSTTVTSAGNTTLTTGLVSIINSNTVATSNGVYRFPVPQSQFVGDWGLRLQKVYLANAVAASDGIVFTNISLDGPRP